MTFGLAVVQRSHCYVAAELDSISGGEEFVVGDNQTYNGFYNAPLVKDNKYSVWIADLRTGDGVSYLEAGVG